MSGLRKDIPKQTDDSQGTGGGTDSGSLRVRADEILRQDARRRRKPYADYLRDAGMMTDWQRRQIRQREVPLPDE